MSRERKIQSRGVAAYGPSRRSALAAGLAAALGGTGAAAGLVPIAAPSADVPGPLRAAIAAHRAAWAAFQGAPDASAGAAQDRETEAFVALLGTPCGTPAGVRVLAAHLAWYIGEEGSNLAGAGDPFGRIARARHADLAWALGEPVPPAASPGPSPLMAAIAAHAEANAAANAAALAHSRAFDADDPAAAELLRLADEACERDDVALTALRAIRPQDLGETAALAEHYASLLEEWEPNGMGEWLFYGLAAALADAV